MVTTFHKTKSGPGLIAKIESDQAWYAFEQLTTMLSTYYARHGAVLEDKDYNDHKFERGKPTWILELIFKGKINGRIKIQYLGDSYEQKYWRSWKSQNFLIYFNFGDDAASKTRRDRFNQAIRAI